MESTEIIANVQNALAANLPSLLSAIAILFFGWIIALFLSSLFGTAMKKLGIGKFLTNLIWGKEKDVDIDVYVKKFSFFILMLFVLIAFFQTLGLSKVNEPLSAFLETIFGYAPRLIAPAILLGVAWLVATFIKLVILKFSKQVKLDERLRAQVIDEPDDVKPKLSEAFAEMAYWLVFLLFLPAILDALALKGLIDPVNSMVNELLGYLPNILGAVVVFTIGWFVAKVVKRIVVKLLDSIGTNKFGKKVGVNHIIGDSSLSESIGMVVYAFILIPVIIASLNSLKLEAITRPASEMLNTILQVIPALFAAGLVLFIAYIVSKILSELVSSLLAGVGFDNVLVKLGFSSEVTASTKRPSEIVGSLVMITILLFAGVEALSLIGFNSLSGILADLTVFAGQVVFGVAILAIGLYIAQVVSKTIKASSAHNSTMLANIARIAILILTFAMGLRQMGIADEIVSIAFGLTLGALAIAVGISFGLGGKDQAGELVKEWVQKLKS